ncbi:MAG: MBL fold metallo-hydrolase [Chloroflexota bacterium]
MSVIAKKGSIEIERLQLGPFGTNAYVVVDRATKDSVIVDAPWEAGTIADRVGDSTVHYILLTHGHGDHVEALEDLCSRLDVPVGVHPQDAARLPVPPDVELQDGQTLAAGSIQLKVLHLPGHTPGSVGFLLPGYLLCGDTLFPGGPGKTSSPARLNEIITSITEKIFTLPDGTLCLPGHGDGTTVGKAREGYQVFHSHAHKPGLCGDVLWLSS